MQHSVFRRVANYTNESHLVSLVDDSIGAGPLNIVLKSKLTHWPQHIKIEENTIRFDNETVDSTDAPVFDSKIPLPPFTDTSKLLLPGIQVLKDILCVNAPIKSLVFLLDPDRLNDFQSSDDFQSRFDLAYVRRMSRAADTWQTGAFLMAVTMMKGCGFGLTPSGDDFIAGLLTALHLIQVHHKINLDPLIEKLLSTAIGTNRLSNAFMESAAKGRLDSSQQHLIHALIYEKHEKLEISARKILDSGETSGADWITGLIFVLEKRVGSWLLSAE